jgi:hypothetical protein
MAKAGDRIRVDGKKGAARTGEIMEVIPSALGEHYRVRWSDGHESDIRPAGGSARIIPAVAPKERKGAERLRAT